MAKLPVPLVQKRFFQVKYPPKLEFYQRLMPAAGLLEEYEDWDTNRLSVVLKDYKAHCSIVIGHDALTYEQDGREAEDTIRARIARVVDELLPGLGVKAATRFGCRTQYLVPVSMSMESLVLVLDTKLHMCDDRLRSIMPPKVTDIMYRVDFAGEDYRCNVTVGPMMRSEIDLWCKYSVDRHLAPSTRKQDEVAILAAYPEVFVYVDLDFWKADDKMDPSDAGKFGLSALDSADDMASRITAYIFSQSIEG